MSRQELQHDAPTELPEAMARLASRKAEERTRAEDELRRLGPAAIDHLMAGLRLESARRKRRRRIGVAMLVGYALFTILLAISGHTRNMGAFTGLISVGVTFLAATQAQKSYARALAQYDDLRAVGPLAEALHFGDKGLFSAARDALMGLLPRVQASDADLLSSEQRAALTRVLAAPKPDFDFYVVVLKALEQVGDGAAIPTVQKLADREATTANERRLQAAARECLPFLEQRAEQERAARLLLRPATSPADPAAALLRPAATAPEAPAEQLLRPADPA